MKHRKTEDYNRSLNAEELEGAVENMEEDIFNPEAADDLSEGNEVDESVWAGVGGVDQRGSAVDIITPDRSGEATPVAHHVAVSVPKAAATLVATVQPGVGNSPSLQSR